MKIRLPLADPPSAPRAMVRRLQAGGDQPKNAAPVPRGEKVPEPLRSRPNAATQSKNPVKAPLPHGQRLAVGAERSTFSRFASARMSLCRQLGMPAFADFQLETVVMGSDSASATRLVPPSAVMM